MPASYDTDSKRFDDLMAEVCPGAMAEVHARISKLRSDWAFEEMAKAKQAPAVLKHPPVFLTK